MPPSHLDQYAKHTPDPAVDGNHGFAVAVHHDSFPALVVEVTGDLDALTAPRLLQTLHAALREPCPVVVVDLTGVAFMGSAGLAALAEAHEQAASHTALRVVAPGRPTLRPLQITGLDTVFQLYPSRHDALTEPADSQQPS